MFAYFPQIFKYFQKWYQITFLKLQNFFNFFENSHPDISENFCKIFNKVSLKLKKIWLKSQNFFDIIKNFSQIFQKWCQLIFLKFWFSHNFFEISLKHHTWVYTQYQINIAIGMREVLSKNEQNGGRTYQFCYRASQRCEY